MDEIDHKDISYALKGAVLHIWAARDNKMYSQCYKYWYYFV